MPCKECQFNNQQKPPYPYGVHDNEPTQCDLGITTTYVGELPLDNLESLPSAIICERDVEDPATGDIKHTLTRVPTERLIPNGNYDNIVAIQSNNPSIIVPEGQVLAGYVQNEGSRIVAYLADATHPAQFLIVGNLADGQILIQPTGVVNIPGGHQYISVAQYYVGAKGQPVTENTSGQKLFIPISNTKLLINGF